MTIQLQLAGQNAYISFQGIELPEKITFGGTQLLSVHQLIGGRRILDALGASDEPLSWSGIFQTSAAVDRARFCDTLRRTGEPCKLTWGEFCYTGVVSQFSADYTRGGLYVPYRITLTVAEDKTAFVESPPQVSTQAQITGDMLRANSLQGCIEDSTLSGLNDSVMSAVQAVTDVIAPIAKGIASAVAAVSGPGNCAIAIMNNARTAITTALGPIAQAQAQAQRLITSAEQAITGITTAGGLLPGNPVAQMTGKFIKQTNAAIQLPPLYEYKAIMGRTTVNLNTLAAQGPTAKTVTVGGGTLQQVAAMQYGDSSMWSLIAQANNLTDPVLSGINTLIIPPSL